MFEVDVRLAAIQRQTLSHILNTLPEAQIHDISIGRFCEELAVSQ
jgi:hypothetical protein